MGLLCFPTTLKHSRIHKLKFCVNARPKSALKDKKANKCLFYLHDKYVVLPADKASNDIIFVCKNYYYSV